jgi:hypothetical protein
MLFLGGITAAEAAKRCRKLCRDQVAACVAAAKTQYVCTGLKGTERRDCKRTLHAAIRECKSMRGAILSACKASTSTDSCSPSGAFLE